MLEFLPPRLSAALRHINLNLLYELRVRADKPLVANLGGAFCYVGENGRTTQREAALVPTEKELSDIVFAASGYSVYSVSEQIKQGFLTGAAGERIGIAGSYVCEGDRVLSVHTVTSLCIRVPHAIPGCAERIYTDCLSNGICSLLLISPPGYGKTTLLRDLSRLVSLRMRLNILVCDERGELSAGELGETSDVMRFSDKRTAFSAGIRAMRPDLIVTDELQTEDYAAARRARESGLHIFASAHLVRVADVPEKIFDRYVVLDGLGTVGAVIGADDVVA